MKRFSLIFLLICALFIVCACESDPTDPTNPGSEDPNIIVEFGFTPQNEYYADVTASASSSWRPTLQLTWGEDTLAVMSTQPPAVSGLYRKRYALTHGYTAGAPYTWSITVDGTTTTVTNMIMKAPSTISQPPSNPFDPTVADSLKWTTGSTGEEPSDQAVYYQYSSAEYALSTRWAKDEDIVLDERKWIIPAGEIPWYVGTTQLHKQLSFYVRLTWAAQTTNSKISYTYFNDSGVEMVYYIDKPPASPIARYRH